MRHLVLTVLVIGSLVGCKSEEVKEQPKPAPVVKPEPKAETPAPATKPAQQPAVKADPFTDPKNPLSKRSIYYDFDKSAIKDEFKPTVQAHASYLKDHAGARVTIEGNCDERGSREYNLALGQRRADSVKGVMKLLGVKEGQVDTVSWGKEKPKAQGHDEAAWAENRRSDIVYQKKE
jgi:peptidoglycan-associated lipoprotein